MYDRHVEFCYRFVGELFVRCPQLLWDRTQPKSPLPVLLEDFFSRSETTQLYAPRSRIMRHQAAVRSCSPTLRWSGQIAAAGFHPGPVSPGVVSAVQQ